MSKTVAIIQARMGSTRLPGKVLLKLGGKTIIDHVIYRATAARCIDDVVVATTAGAIDDPLVEHVSRQSISIHRGSDSDVLSRFEGAARQVQADCVVRLTADDPVKDPDVIDEVITAFQMADPPIDYASNTLTPSWPEGQDTEVMSSDALYKAAANAADPYEREHVTPFIYRHQDLFRCFNVARKPDLSRIRLTLDTPDDYLFFEKIFEALDATGQMIRLPHILELLQDRPDLAAINAAIERSDAYK